MIQDIAPHHFSNHFPDTRVIGEGDYIFHFQKENLLLKHHNGQLHFPIRQDFGGKIDAGIFLFTLNDTPCFLAESCVIPDHPDFVYHDISFFRNIAQKEVAYTSIVALQLMHWYNDNRFCGKCGSLVHHKSDERALVCDACGNLLFPRISPAIIVAIICKDRILLAKGVNFRGGFYSLVAGYADIGETLEEAVSREVKEEVGLDVTGIRYYSSQPWPLSASMMIGFIAYADDRQPVVIDPHEISDAAWYSRDHLPSHPPASISIAGEMIEKFRNGDPDLR